MRIQSNAVLMQAARTAAQNAYAPYSEFRVGAAVLTESGEVVTGCNVENAAYGTTICAEANAISTAVAQGVGPLKSIAVACVDADSTEDAYPCGNCRQIINEFGISIVHVGIGTGEASSHEASELLPHGFQLTDRPDNA